MNLNNYSPQTNMIIGAMLSGGDPMIMAYMLMHSHNDTENYCPTCGASFADIRWCDGEKCEKCYHRDES